MIEVLKIKLDPGAYMPERAHPTDAGIDLKTPTEVTLFPHSSVIIDTGVHIGFPHRYYGKIESKSGLNVKHNVVSLGGTIDEPYTGSIFVKLYNEGTETYVFHAGDKVAQLIIQPYIAPEMVIVDELDETDRGDSGFGSTGR